MGMAGAIAGSAAAGLAGSLISSSAASSASDKQVAAGQQASDASLKQQALVREDLGPYRDAGSATLRTLQDRLPNLTSAFNPDQATLEATPGYKFTRDQGLQAVQSAASAKGLGVSGAALKGAAQYATGLADNTYQTQFNIDQANKTNAYNKLMGLVGAGQSSAAQTGAFGQQATQNSNNFLTSGAAASAAGTVGGANAIAGGLNSAGNSAMNGYLLNKLMPGGSSGGSGSGVETGNWG